MKIDLKEISIGALTRGYADDDEGGVVGYYGNLNIRPAYQREFVYKDKQREAVINTVRADFPLNVMYWVHNGDETYEVLDGQQRAISICQYVNGDYSINHQFFHNLEEDEQKQILDYKLMVYFCEGEDKEKLDWFETINIAGEKLSNQELRNAIYTGPWLANAKQYFSKTGGPAYGIGSKLLMGSAIRQDYLETAIKWISNNNVEDYMSDHQHDENAQDLWMYYQDVINWVNTRFPNYTKFMKGQDWGYLYNNYKDVQVDQKEIEDLLLDDEVTKLKGVYPYVLSREEKHLSLRSFTDKQKQQMYIRQEKTCFDCEEEMEISKMEGEHIIPWSQGGKTDLDNGCMVCLPCHKERTRKQVSK